jgi:hypothetical protein
MDTRWANENREPDQFKWADEFQPNLTILQRNKRTVTRERHGEAPDAQFSSVWVGRLDGSGFGWANKMVGWV